jgi:hypothetical protein
MKIQHIRTKATFEVTKEAATMYHVKVIELPSPVPGLKIGMPQKIAKGAIGITYTILYFLALLKTNNT